VVGVELTRVDLCHSLCSKELAETQLYLSRGLLQHDRHILIFGYALLHHACQTRLRAAPPVVASEAGKPPRVDHLNFSLPPSDSFLRS
jgi:hypothetical protein